MWNKLCVGGDLAVQTGALPSYVMKRVIEKYERFREILCIALHCFKLTYTVYGKLNLYFNSTLLKM